MNQFKRSFVGASACVALALASATAMAAGKHKPDALLSIDLNRAAVVEKIVSAWGNEIPAAQRESFKTKLQSLRADHLLSANLSGSFEGVLEVLNAHESAQKINALPAAQNGSVLGNISEKIGTDKAKALGDETADLVYTPITPCRLFDTRAGQVSALGVVGGTFSNQQRRSIVPAGACGIPTTGVASLFLSYHAYTYNPAVLGVIGFMKPGDPFSALAGAWTGGVWVTSTYITSTSANGNFDAFVGNGSAMTADMIVDVMGYFRAPQGTIGDITDIQTAAGSGLTGGVTSGAVNLSLANSYKLPQSCANAQVPKFNSATSLWECQNDLQGTGAGGTGTVTNIATGAGLTGGPITTTGTIGLAATQLMPTTACTSGQVAKWSGTAWACAADATVTNAWTQGGNAFGAAGVIGTTDAQNLTVQSAGSQISLLLTTGDGLRVLQNAASGIPNIINGDTTNALSNSGGTLRGATISGGSGNIVGDSNGSNGWFGTIGGGQNNRAGNPTSTGGNYATVSGGIGNTASGGSSTIGGGESNTANGFQSTIGGGGGNVVSGSRSTVAGGGASTQSNCLEPSNGTNTRYCGNRAIQDYATVGGGVANLASTSTATISGGQANTSSGAGSSVGGGYGNIANSTHSTVAGGGLNKAQADFATVGGGSTNTASGASATVSGGSSNAASSGQATVAGGQSNNATGGGSTISGGFANTSSAAYSAIGGGTSNSSSGDQSVVSGGDRNSSQGTFSSVSGGRAAVARSYGQHARAAGSFILDQNGTAQHSEYILRRLTTDATPTDLKLDGASEDLTMEPGRASLLDIQVIGLQDNFQVGTYTFKCMLQQVAPGNTFLLPAGCNKAIIQEDVAAWDVNVTNTVDGKLKISATGTAGVSIRWVATVRAVEVKW